MEHITHPEPTEMEVWQIERFMNRVYARINVATAGLTRKLDLTEAEEQARWDAEQLVGQMLFDRPWIHQAADDTEIKNEDARIDRMVRVLWNLSPRELARLTDIHVDRLTETMQIAIGRRVDEASIFGRDDTYRGNAFMDYLRQNPVHGPQPAPVEVGYGDCPF